MAEKNMRIVIISGPSSKLNPILQKYEVEYAFVPAGEFLDEKKHEMKIKFFTDRSDAIKWCEEVTEESE